MFRIHFHSCRIVKFLFLNIIIITYMKYQSVVKDEGWLELIFHPCHILRYLPGLLIICTFTFFASQPDVICEMTTDVHVFQMLYKC